MELWLDTINEASVRKAVRMGILTGVTTNPTLLANAKSKPENVIERLLSIQDGPIAVQVVADTVEEMVRQGEMLHAMSGRIIVKVPVSHEGYEAMRLFQKDQILSMATVVFHPSQALLAASAGACYIAPYISRIALTGGEPFDLLQSMSDVVHHHKQDVKILAASLKTASQVIQCAQMGVDAVTLKDSLFHEFIAVPEDTRKTIAAFHEDWQQIDSALFSP